MWSGTYLLNITVTPWSVCRRTPEVLTRALALPFTGNRSDRYLSSSAAIGVFMMDVFNHR